MRTLNLMVGRQACALSSVHHVPMNQCLGMNPIARHASSADRQLTTRIELKRPGFHLCKLKANETARLIVILVPPPMSHFHLFPAT
jgi:hypothetical protein